MGNQISHLLTNKHLLEKLQLIRLDGLSKDPTLLSAHVVIANHLIVSMLWYTLSLWVGLDLGIKCLQSIITRFIWTQNKSTCFTVDLLTIFLFKLDGGLGLISIAQVIALASKLMVWAMSTGNHQIKTILQQKFRKLLKIKYGVSDFSWALIPCKTLPKDDLELWKNVCKSYNKAKSSLVPDQLG